MSDKPAKEEKPAGKKGLPLVPIIGLVLILNIAVVAKVFMGGNKQKTVIKVEKIPDEVGKKLNLDEFFMNLAGGNDHFLKCTVALGLRKDLDEKKMEEEIAPIRDVCISVLSAKTVENLLGTEGKEKLKVELKEKLNKELGSEKIIKVYFVNFAIQ